MSDKPPKVMDAEISADGLLMVQFNQQVKPFTGKKAVFTPEALLRIIEEYGEIPDSEDLEDKDYAGMPHVDEADVFDDEKESEDPRIPLSGDGVVKNEEE